MAMNHKIAMHFAARDAEALERAQRRQENPVAVATAQFSAEFSEARKSMTCFAIIYWQLFKCFIFLLELSVPSVDHL